MLGCKGFGEKSIAWCKFEGRDAIFHVTVHLFSDRLQMMSRSGAAKYVTDVWTIFWLLLWSTNAQTHGDMEFIFYEVKKDKTVHYGIINASVFQLAHIEFK